MRVDNQYGHSIVITKKCRQILSSMTNFELDKALHLYIGVSGCTTNISF